MTQNTHSSWNFYKGWDVYQGQLVRAIEPLTAEQLELKISPHLRSIGQLARHIVRTRAGCLYNMMGECGTTPMGHPQPSQLQTTSTSCPTSPRLPGLRTALCTRFSPTASTMEIPATTYKPTSTPISAHLLKRNPGEQVLMPTPDIRTAPYFSAVTCKASTRNLAI